MLKQILILLGFILTGDFFIGVACAGLLNTPTDCITAVVVGGLWGGYVAHRAIRSGVFN